MDEPTYIDMKTKCRFIDVDYGAWWTSPDCIINRKQGHRKRWVAEFSEKSLLTIDTIKEKLCISHNNRVCLDELTYIDMKTKCGFIDKEFGYWLARPSNVINRGHGHPKRSKEKFKATNLKRYGVEYPMQNPKVALKAAKSLNNSFVIGHWKTGEELICVASYEKKVVEYLNTNKIDFKWQHKAFKMPNGRTFRPDCYLVGKRKPWIEIKGYFRKDAKEKWDWFHKEHPNSELWDKNKLKEMKIL